MNQLALNQSPKSFTPGCADELMPMAERELAGFFSAVTELYGSEQAKLSAEDWVQELEAMDGIPASTRELRLISIRVAKQLAIQMKASSAFQESPTLGGRICVFSSLAPQAL